MAALKNFRILRKETPEWSYVLQIEGEGGNITELTVTFEDLDRMAVAIDEEMLAIVEATAQLDT